MKAAGLIAGISNAMRDFWLYDIETRRNSTKEDFIRRFSECYTMNALSVQMQYDDPAPETDSNEYRDEINEFYKLGQQLVYNGGRVLTDAVHELQSFFGSALYQTEYEPYMYKMQMFFNSLTCQLWEKAYKHEDASWSSLKITPPDHKYQIIM